MNPFLAAIVGSSFTAFGGMVVYMIKSKSKESAEQVFKDQIAGALAVWEKGFRERVRAEGFLELSARDYLKLTSAIQGTLNGRYWLAGDARLAMKELHQSMETNTEKLHARISRLGDEFDSKLTRFDDRLGDKVDKP